MIYIVDRWRWSFALIRGEVQKRTKKLVYVNPDSCTVLAATSKYYNVRSNGRYSVADAHEDLYDAVEAFVTMGQCDLDLLMNDARILEDAINTAKKALIYATPA